MGERKSLLKKTISFKGVFNIQEIYSLIDDFFTAKGYERWERLNEEIVDEQGKQVSIKMFPNKKTSDYTKNVVKIILSFRDVTDVTIEVDGKKKRMQKGAAKVALEAFLETDHEGRMTNRPFYFFMRELFDRFIYRVYIGKAEAILIEDAEHVRALLKDYFNIKHQ